MRVILIPLFSAALLCGPASAGVELIFDAPEPSPDIDMDLEPYVPPSGVPSGLGDAETADIVRACDELAAHPGNRENPEGIKGVAYTKLEGSKALPACLKAVEVEPKILRLKYQLARAKQASGQGLDAIKDLQELAKKDYVPAINNLGATYQIGIGVEKDYSKAVSWYEKAADKGFVPSMSILGWMSHKGLGTPQDDAKALSWYRKAADQGSASAMHSIGFSYHNGWGVDTDPTEAAKWFHKSADLGFGPAMTMTAWTWQVGRGVPLNSKRAIDWYEKASEEKQLSAVAALGSFYDTGGPDMAPRPTKAAEWLLKALRQGSLATRNRLIDKPETLKPETRRQIQTQLKTMGFDPGSADGVFGSKTRDAIDEAFTAP